MDNLNDLKAIWHTAKTSDLPGADEMPRAVRRFRNQKLRSKWRVIVLSAALIVFWIWFMWYFKPVMLSTWLGAGLTVLSSVVLIWTNVRSMKRFYGLNDCSNKEFLAFLEQTRRNQLYFHTRTQVLGLGLSTLGAMLFLYEFVHGDVVVFIGFYAAILLLILVNWLFVRQWSFKKQSAKMNAAIAKLEKISNQININEHE